MDTPSNNPNSQMNQTPTPSGMSQTPPTPAPSKGGSGPLIGIIVIVLVLIAGAFYLWMDSRQMPSDVSPYGMNEKEGVIDAITAALGQVGSSDTASAIEADLSATDTGDLNAELSTVAEQL